MRAYRAIRMKLFLRPDQEIEDDALRFVELPELAGQAPCGSSGQGPIPCTACSSPAWRWGRPARSSRTSSPRSPWSPARAKRSSRDSWPLSREGEDQRRLMAALAGPFMGEGANPHKKGKTYEWPLVHLGDAFGEVTPRSFLGMMISAAQLGDAPPGRVITPSGIQHGLRAASKTRVDQLHQEFPWIKGVLVPLAGLLLPKEERDVLNIWRKAGTREVALADAAPEGCLGPIPDGSGDERGLYDAMERIGVMYRRQDGRVDMPDLFRVAAKLLKKGGTAPL